jgi:hypothetical protein
MAIVRNKKSNHKIRVIRVHPRMEFDRINKIFRILVLAGFAGEDLNPAKILSILSKQRVQLEYGKLRGPRIGGSRQRPSSRPSGWRRSADSK